MKKEKKHSPFTEKAVQRSMSSEELSASSSHKHRNDWLTKLEEAKATWNSPQHDEDIKNVPPGTHEDELRVAVMWECFRHLYFSERLSPFWRAMVEGKRFEGLERYWDNTSEVVSYTSTSRDSYAAPWNLWADHPDFPLHAWSILTAGAKKENALRAVVVDAPPVCLLKDNLYGWGHIHSWCRDCETKISHSLNDPTLPLSDEPLELFNGSVSTVAFKINWAAVTKEDLLNGVWQHIEKLWQARNPTGKKGRPTSLLSFFDGLVMLRRGARGIEGADICKGTAYTAQMDGRMNVLNVAAKKALKFASSKLAETLKALEKVERLLAGT
jgi:hypothetical protein